MTPEIWLQCQKRLEQELPAQIFTTWIRPLVYVDYSGDENCLRLGAPNRTKLDWVRSQFAGRIEGLVSEVSGSPIAVKYELAVLTQGVKNEAKAAALTDELASETASQPFDSLESTEAQEPSIPMPSPTLGGYSAASNRHTEKAKLNPDLTFEHFVTGKANQMARAAAEQVSDRPGTSYNPLFFYGGVGLGKTHLIQAVGNTVLQRNPNARVRYIHAEQYVSDVVRAYQRKAFDEFKSYYHSLDLLLIDDIQFFAGKSRTQEEFFYAFEALANARKQIIITSDTYPKDMAGFEERLVSRFGSGLTVTIEPPELEMRVAILMKKAETMGCKIGEDVCFFIAKALRSNVRELEGALKKVLAFSNFHNRKVDLELVKEALKEILTVSRVAVGVETIQKTVADYYKIKVADMYSKRRPANIALPRQIAMYLAKELTQKSLPEIGELFGGRDHTTVLHAVRKINEARARDTTLNHDLHVLEQTLRA